MHALLLLVAAAAAAKPEGFHTSWSAGGGLWVTWVYPNATVQPSAPLCRWRVAEGRLLEGTVPANTTTYSDKCDAPKCTQWVGWIATAELPAKAAQAARTLEYSCGDGDELSPWQSVRSRKAGGKVTFAMTADAGANRDAENVATHMARDPRVLGSDFFLMIGDIAYTGGVQSVWDDFHTLWEPVMAAVPTLFSPGNHDGDWVFGNNYKMPQSSWVGGGESGTAYSLRLPGPGERVHFASRHPNVPDMSSTSYWWSAGFGPLRIIATSGVHEFEKGSEQYAWLEAELAKAAGNREAEPWVVVTNHFPMYCTINDCFCGNYTAAARRQECQPGRDGKFMPGILEINGVRMKDALEELLLRYKVDLFVAGHEHAYERTLPVADLTADPHNLHYGQGAVFTNPAAPVHVMAGTGGGGPDTEWRKKQDFPWTSIRSDGAYDDTRPFGYMIYEVSEDRTTLSAEYFNTVEGGKAVQKDSFSIVKKK